MYLPKYFENNDLGQAVEFIKNHPFATLISCQNNLPEISLLPLSCQIEKEKMILIGHMARSNPLWQQMAKASVTVLFHGSHSYITPMWYVSEGVPTWNYSVLEARGRAVVKEDEKSVVESLEHLVKSIESHYQTGYQFDEVTSKKLLKSIVAFQIEIESYVFKQKLSQNRLPQDFAGVLNGLAGRKDEDSLAIREAMIKLSASKPE